MAARRRRDKAGAVDRGDRDAQGVWGVIHRARVVTALPLDAAIWLLTSHGVLFLGLVARADRRGRCRDDRQIRGASEQTS